MTEVIKAYRADPFSYSEARAVAEGLGVSDPVAVTLVRRGYRTPEAARDFLQANESHDPRRFESMDRVVGMVRAAIEGGERITVHGDFDVDGVCATAILVGALRELGAECDWLIPDRATDGYGLNLDNVDVLARRGTSLLITVDCGVTAVEEVAAAQAVGMKVVVTDHHQAGKDLPDCPLIHPAIDNYPFEGLCGTAVAWKLACALGSGRQLDRDLDLDLVALATVADMVPLVGENRSLVKRGLEELRRAQRPGIRALLKVAGVEPTSLDEGDLSFRLAPRINAAGRLYRADAGVELLLTEDEARAAEIAAELGRANSERQLTERRVSSAAEAARRELPDELRDGPALVLAGEGWHPGVIGIVASKIVERHHRPAIVIALDGEGGGRGSGRSIPGFDLLGALEACSEHLVGFGGHRAAAGLELRAESVDAFREAFVAHAAGVLGPEDLRRTERVDAIVGGAGLGLDLAEELEQLAPFGMGNPGVRLLVPGARVRDVRPMGATGKHARFSLHSGAHRALGVAFGRASLGVGEEDTVDASVRLEINHWNGSVEPRVVLGEIYPHTREDDRSGTAAEEAARWWHRFEEELRADLGQWPPKAPGGDPASAASKRLTVRASSSAAAVLSELAACDEGGGVLGVVADLPRRDLLAKTGAALADYAELEREPSLAGEFEHVVLVDPAPFAHLDRLVEVASAEGGYLHVVWATAEVGFALAALGDQLARRAVLAGVFRDLRDGTEELYEALRGFGPHPRAPQAAARCFRVLAELGLVQGEPNRGDGTVGVVSSEGIDLERSAAYRAYSARYQEGRRYLEGRKQT